MTALEQLPAELVGRAIVAYVGHGEVVRPTRRRDVVVALAPGGRGDELLAVVERLHDEADTIQVAAGEAVGHSLLPAFAAKFRTRHPWVDDPTVEALGWASRYRQTFE